MVTGARARLRQAWGAVALAVACLTAKDATYARMNIDELSLMTTPILLFDGARQVSLGTGFFFASSDGDGKLKIPFLVTNYHVLTGYSPGETGPRKADRIKFFLHTDRSKPESVKAVEFPLYTTKGEPVWLANTKEPSADVALVPMPDTVFAGTQVIVFADKDLTSNMRITPTSPVTLIGYPHGYFDTENFLPIWKRGSIASEPDYDFQGQRLFVVDVSAFPGMSGSPVLAIAAGMYPGKEGGTVVGDVRQLLGVFASLQMVQEKKFVEEIAIEAPKLAVTQATSLQLGHVWKAEIIKEIVQAFDPVGYEKRILAFLPKK